MGEGTLKAKEVTHTGVTIIYIQDMINREEEDKLIVGRSVVTTCVGGPGGVPRRMSWTRKRLRSTMV